MKILVTGTAGFIGFHLANALAKEGHDVVGLDNINDYYDVRLKYARLIEAGIDENEIKYNSFAVSKKHPNYKFIKLNLEDNDNIQRIFKDEQFEIVCNLAAQAGVRYSIENPYSYIQSNIVGFLNILEACRHNQIQHLIYASSSSVYGNSDKVPFSEEDVVNKPVSLYAATKISNELMAYTYSHLYQLKTTGLRFFTVYGPWGRPDMAPFIFADKILNNKPIDVYNYGNLKRDFTFVDDIILGLTAIISKTQEKFFEIFNIGNSTAIDLMAFIKFMAKSMQKEVIINYKGMQLGDVYQTYANTQKLQELVNFQPNTSIFQGIPIFVNWYSEYLYKIFDYENQE